MSLFDKSAQENAFHSIENSSYKDYFVSDNSTEGSLTGMGNFSKKNDGMFSNNNSLFNNNQN